MATSLSVPDQLRRQAGWCKLFGSALYNHLLSGCAENFENGGALRTLLQGHEADPEATALPLRLMGAVHWLVLGGEAPQLSKFYPSVGGTVDLDGAWIAFKHTIQQHMADLGRLITNPVQTNDVGRSGSLLGGFALIAERTRLPLRLLEIGTSAGLNLRWDRYRYEWSSGGWGDIASAVRLENVFVGAAPSIPPHIQIVERSGCDPLPVDISNDSGRLTLLSYIWSDQLERIERARAAVEIARNVPCFIDKSNGAEWLEERLERSTVGVATVIFHSFVWSYISDREQRRIAAAIQNAASRVSEDAPLAWLRMEPNDDNAFEIRLRIQPGFEEQIIGTSRPHSPSVSWLRN
jgi:hypothetical protein